MVVSANLVKCTSAAQGKLEPATMPGERSVLRHRLLNYTSHGFSSSFSSKPQEISSSEEPKGTKVQGYKETRYKGSLVPLSLVLLVLVPEDPGTVVQRYKYKRLKGYKVQGFKGTKVNPS